MWSGFGSGGGIVEGGVFVIEMVRLLWRWCIDSGLFGCYGGGGTIIYMVVVVVVIIRDILL